MDSKETQFGSSILGVYDEPNFIEKESKQNTKLHHFIQNSSLPFKSWINQKVMKNSVQEDKEFTEMLLTKYSVLYPKTPKSLIRYWIAKEYEKIGKFEFALNLLRTALKENGKNNAVLFHLGMMLIDKGVNNPEYYKEGWEILNSLENYLNSTDREEYVEGESEFHLFVGHCFQNGNGIPKNKKKAEYHYRESLKTNKNQKDAMVYLALILTNGNFILNYGFGESIMTEEDKNNFDEAIDLLDQASKLGSALGKYYLGKYMIDNFDKYETGNNAKGLNNKGTQLLIESAKMGNVKAKEALHELDIATIEED